VGQGRVTDEAAMVASSRPHDFRVRLERAGIVATGQQDPDPQTADTVQRLQSLI